MHRFFETFFYFTDKHLSYLKIQSYLQNLKLVYQYLSKWCMTFLSTKTRQIIKIPFVIVKTKNLTKSNSSKKISQLNMMSWENFYQRIRTASYRKKSYHTFGMIGPFGLTLIFWQWFLALYMIELFRIRTVFMQTTFNYLSFTWVKLVSLKYLVFGR